VIAHESFEHWLANDSSVIGPILSARTGLTAFAGRDGATGEIHGALGPGFVPGPMSTSMPTIKVTETVDLDLAGEPDVDLVLGVPVGGKHSHLDAVLLSSTTSNQPCRVPDCSFPCEATVRPALSVRAPGTARSRLSQWRARNSAGASGRSSATRR
jgi:hypothetical protein